MYYTSRRIEKPDGIKNLVRNVIRKELRLSRGSPFLNSNTVFEGQSYGQQVNALQNSWMKKPTIDPYSLLEDGEPESEDGNSNPDETEDQAQKEGSVMKISERQLRRIIRSALITELCKSPPGSLTISGCAIDEEEDMLAEDDLEEYWTPGIDTSGRVDRKNRRVKPTGEQMGCKDRRTGKTTEPYWQDRMGQWVCP